MAFMKDIPFLGITINDELVVAEDCTINFVMASEQGARDADFTSDEPIVLKCTGSTLTPMTDQDWIAQWMMIQLLTLPWYRLN